MFFFRRLNLASFTKIKILFRRLEAPDVTGSSLTLGAAGSRRTVYLIDENQKLPETRSSGNTPEPQTPKNNNCNSSNGSSGSNSLTNNNSSTQNTPATVTESPSTFLMYNRINTMISSGGSPTDPNGSNTSLTGNILSSTTNPVDDKLLRKKQEEKSSSIWYEYGCV